MADKDDAAADPVRFEAHPDRYRHWKIELPPEHEGHVARLVLHVPEDGGVRPGYVLKLNSYDLGVDVELADALQRIRFEHPRVKAVVFSSGRDRIFCSGANIYMLGSSSHAFKVNFCKFTNETRLYLEEMSAESGIHSLAALQGTASGGGYELALACDEIVLVDDGASAVSLPEAPLLGCFRGPAGSRGSSISAKCGGILPTCSRRWPRGCAASARSSGPRRRGAPQGGVRRRGEAPARRDGRAIHAPHVRAGPPRAARAEAICGGHRVPIRLACPR
jgi:hypothetical protein